MKLGNISVILGFGAVVTLGMAPVFSTPSPAEELEKIKNIVADQIRDQGYKCDKPSGAVRDTGASRPNEVVWLLTCEDANYRVRLVPDMAAHVERLPDGAATGTSTKTQP